MYRSFTRVGVWVGVASISVTAGAFVSVGEPAHAASVPSGRTANVAIASLSSSGAQGSAQSDTASVSADGRYVLFRSDAPNLVAGDTNSTGDLFVRDTVSNTTTLVDVSYAGGPSNTGALTGQISGDGHFAVFASGGGDLIAGVTGLQVYERNLVSGTTTLVSKDSAGVQGNDDSLDPAVSSDGTRVAFSSAATNLIPSDTNGASDVFMRDLAPGSTTRVSVATDGTELPAGDGGGFRIPPSISADGSRVTFSTLVGPGTPGMRVIELRDTDEGTTTLVSKTPSGAVPNAWSSQARISPDGFSVAYASDASNVIAGDTNAATDVFVADLAADKTYRVSVASDGTQANGVSDEPSVSSNGTVVSFSSAATNLISPVDANGSRDVFMFDRSANSLALVSASTAGVQGVGASGEPVITPDASRVAFQSAAANLVVGDTNNKTDVFVRDRPVAVPIVSVTDTPAVTPLTEPTFPTPSPVSLPSYTPAGAGFADLRGSVEVALTHKAIPNATVTVGPGGPAATTDSKGNFAIAHIPVVAPYSEFVITATATGHGQFQSTGNRLYDNQGHTLLITMSSAPTATTLGAPLEEAAPDPRNLPDADDSGNQPSPPTTHLLPASLRMQHVTKDSQCRSAVTPKKDPTGKNWLTKPSQVSTETLSMDFYLRTVLASEMTPTDPPEALKAVAMAAKDFAWYWVNHRGRGYTNGDVDDSTDYQCYNENRPVTDSINSAIDATEARALQDSSGQIIQLSYWNGAAGVPAPLCDPQPADGRLHQNGAKAYAGTPGCGSLSSDDLLQHYYNVSGNGYSYFTIDVPTQPSLISQRPVGGTVYLTGGESQGGFQCLVKKKVGSTYVDQFHCYIDRSGNMNMTFADGTVSSGAGVWWALYTWSPGGWSAPRTLYVSPLVSQLWNPSFETPPNQYGALRGWDIFNAYGDTNWFCSTPADGNCDQQLRTNTNSPSGDVVLNQDFSYPTGSSKACPAISLYRPNYEGKGVMTMTVSRGGEWLRGTAAVPADSKWHTYAFQCGQFSNTQSAASFTVDLSDVSGNSKTFYVDRAVLTFV